MATSNAERQRKYRTRHLVEGSDSRLGVVLAAGAAAQLKRLARHHGMTQKALIESLLSQAESIVTASMADPRRYFEPVAA